MRLDEALLTYPQTAAGRGTCSSGKDHFMQSDLNITLFVVKLFGGIAGSIISLSVLIPATRRETVARTATGVSSSVLLTTPLSDAVGWGDRGVEYVLAASGLTAFAAWFLFGLLARTANRWKTLDDAMRDINTIRKGKDK